MSNKEFYNCDINYTKSNIDSLVKNKINVVKIKELESFEILGKKSNSNKFIVDINNSAFFGYRALENGTKGIIINIFAIDNIVKTIKYLNKFNSRIYLNFDINNLLLRNDEKMIHKMCLEISEKIIEIQEIITNDEIFLIFEKSLKCDPILQRIIFVLKNIFNKYSILFI